MLILNAVGLQIRPSGSVILLMFYPLIPQMKEK